MADYKAYKMHFCPFSYIPFFINCSLIVIKKAKAVVITELKLKQ